MLLKGRIGEVFHGSLCLALSTLYFARQLDASLEYQPSFRNKAQSTKNKAPNRLDSRSHVHDLDIWDMAIKLISRFLLDFCWNCHETCLWPRICSGSHPHLHLLEPANVRWEADDSAVAYPEATKRVCRSHSSRASVWDFRVSCT